MVDFNLLHSCKVEGVHKLEEEDDKREGNKEDELGEASNTRRVSIILVYMNVIECYSYYYKSTVVIAFNFKC